MSEKPEHLWFLNSLATIRVSCAQGSDGVTVMEQLLRYRDSAPLHLHRNEDEISYILEGQVAILQGDEVTIAGPGSYVVKPRGIFHAFWNASDEPARMIEVIAPGGFEQYFRELAPLIPQNATPDFGSVIALGQRYGLEYDMQRVPELIQRYGLNMG